jgi:hypothetical protein
MSLAITFDTFWERGAPTAQRAKTATQPPTDRPRPTDPDRGRRDTPAEAARRPGAHGGATTERSHPGDGARGAEARRREGL